MVKYDATVESDAFGVVDQLRQDGINIAHLDIVVANAGIAKYYPFVKDVKRAQIQEHLDVNVFGVVALYQATRELLRKSPRTEGDGKKKPVFVPVGSSAGTLGYVVTRSVPTTPRHPKVPYQYDLLKKKQKKNRRQLDIPNAAYGPTKTMLNWYGVRINAEDDWLNAFVLDPGFVQTDMGNEAASFFGMEQATLTVDESADGMFRVITTGTKEDFGGRLVFYTGEVLAW